MNKPTILIVDDEQLNIQLIADILNEEYNIKIAFDGQKALKVLEKIDIDLILLDINMPIMDGYETAQYLTNDEKLKKIPFIFLTAKQDQNSIVKGFELGAVDYISKPFNKEELLVRVSNHINTYFLQKDLSNKIEELKEAKELALKQQKTILTNSKMASLSEMIENIAHQWRQPLSIISTAATSLQFENEISKLEDEDINKHCTVINNNAQYLSNIIDEFKKFINKDHERIRFDLKNDTDHFLKLIDSTIEKYHIQVILDLHENIEIQGYPKDLIECFINIFNNSKDALLKLNDKERYIFISQNNLKDKISIEFKDNGGGIDQDIINNIFEPYYTTKHKSQGTGLGLYITYKIIMDVLKGSIEVENETFEFKGKQYTGAKFTITLPLNS